MKNVLERWVEELAADPVGSVDAILTGRMSKGALQGEDADAFFVAALGLGERREEVREKLDEGIAAWLGERRGMSLAQISGYGVSALISQLERAFITVARIGLPATVSQLIEEYLVWEEWLTPLRRLDWIDLLAAFDEALALNQDDDRFSPRWFDLLAGAAWGGTTWKRSLRLGLLGLRKLPHAPGTQPERVVVAGLIHFVDHALRNRLLPAAEVESIFQREAIALTDLYPRSVEHWQTVWEAALAQVSTGRRGGAGLAGWLQRQLVLLLLLPQEQTPAERKASPKASRPNAGTNIQPSFPPSTEKRERLLRRLDRERFSEALWTEIREHVGLELTYAERSGDGYFAVLTISNFGNRLLRSSPTLGAILVLRSWIISALSYEPDDAFSWDLWAKIHQALGRHEEALAILWETVRRFPQNVVVRNHLAKLLASRERRPLAESVLRDTLRDFNDVVTRHTLAKLLRVSERIPEAEDLLRKAILVRPMNVPSFCELADLLLDGGKLEEAEELLLTVNAAGKANQHTLVILARCYARRARGPREDALKWLGQADEVVATAARKYPRDRAVIDLGDYLSKERKRLIPREEGGTDGSMTGEPDDLEMVDPVEPEALDFSGLVAGNVDEQALALSAEGVEIGELEQEAENFLARNVKRGKEYAAWYESRQGNGAPAGDELGAMDEVGAAFRCVRFQGDSVVIHAPSPRTLEAQPGSYSLQLLAAYAQGGENDTRRFMTEAVKIGHQYADVSDWLLLPILPEPRKRELLRQGEKTGVSLERLETIYPGLAQSRNSSARLAQLEADGPAYTRLVSDVALATAARTQPRTASSGPLG